MTLPHTRAFGYHSRKKPLNVIGAENLRTPSLSDLLTELQANMEGADGGLRLISAFLRIRDPALRAEAVDFVSELAERSEQASKDRPADLRDE